MKYGVDLVIFYKKTRKFPKTLWCVILFAMTLFYTERVMGMLSSKLAKTTPSMKTITWTNMGEPSSTDTASLWVKLDESMELFIHQFQTKRKNKKPHATDTQYINAFKDFLESSKAIMQLSRQLTVDRGKDPGKTWVVQVQLPLSNDDQITVIRGVLLVGSKMAKRLDDLMDLGDCDYSVNCGWTFPEDTPRDLPAIICKSLNSIWRMLENAGPPPTGCRRDFRTIRGAIDDWTREGKLAGWPEHQDLSPPEWFNLPLCEE